MMDGQRRIVIKEEEKENMLMVTWVCGLWCHSGCANISNHNRFSSEHNQSFHASFTKEYTSLPSLPKINHRIIKQPESSDNFAITNNPAFYSNYYNPSLHPQLPPNQIHPSPIPPNEAHGALCVPSREMTKCRLVLGKTVGPV